MHTLLKKMIFLVGAVVLIFAGLQAEAQSTISESQLNGSVVKLIDALKIERQKNVRRQVLESFHQELSTEITSMNEKGIRDSLYWKAVELDTNLIRILGEKNCSEIKRAISYNYESLPEISPKSVESELKTALTIADLVCEN